MEESNAEHHQGSDTVSAHESEPLPLSPLTKALIQAYKPAKSEESLGSQKIRVSRTVSAAAFLLEKIRNAVEFREEHLVRRAAIERIIRRRLLFNSQGTNIAGLVIKELIWAKYLPSGVLAESNIAYIQETIDKYLKLKNQLLAQSPPNKQTFYSDFLLQVASAEIEERLTLTKRLDAFINFIYQLIRPAITVNHRENEERDLQVYIAVSRSFAKSDTELLRYQLFKLYLPNIEKKGPEVVTTLLPEIADVINSIEGQLQNPIGNKLQLYVRRQVPPYLILKELFDTKGRGLEEMLKNVENLREEVWSTCSLLYSQTGKRLRSLAVRSIIYIFITKMVFVLLVEIPADQWLRGKIDLLPLSINTLFPPLLMFFITLTTSAPGESNTKRIFKRIEEIITQPSLRHQTKINVTTHTISMRPMLTFFFTLLYGIAFLISFGGVIYLLQRLNFSIVSQAVFVFFLCVITFFGYRVRQTAREYLYEEREGIFSPIVDFFMLPILQVGRWLSSEIARLNVFTYIFDFFFEIPLKGILEILEEWFSFIRNKKEEIA